MKDKEMIEICENCKIKDNCSHRILTHMEKCKVSDCDYFQNISTNKEKQIEEMANIIKSVKYEPFNDGKPTYTVGNQMQDFVFDLIAEELLKHYQPKLPEDSVVLSTEEFNNLKYAKIERDRLNKSVKYYQGLIEDGKLVASQEVEQASKETAEKFYKKVRKLLKKVDIIVDGDEGLVGYEESAVDKGLTEIAKQYGVEIKE